jgi:hypothetical protein
VGESVAGWSVKGECVSGQGSGDAASGLTDYG